MEGYSKFTYCDKTIFYEDYSIFQSHPDQKEKVVELLKFIQGDLLKQPLNSVLSLVNVSNLKFDMLILKLFKESTQLTSPYERKIAVLGVKGMLKSGYNFVIGLTSKRQVKAFETEQEAKDWLVKED